MKLLLVRCMLAPNYTIGHLHNITGGASIPLCFTLEDTVRSGGTKVVNETCIPSGEYQIKIRRGSPMSNRYDKQYQDIGHDGMLWLQDVPGFEWVYIHVGNTAKDTAGCILVGEGGSVKGGVVRSRACYRSIYPRIHKAAKAGKCSIRIE